MTARSHTRTRRRQKARQARKRRTDSARLEVDRGDYRTGPSARRLLDVPSQRGTGR
ncbi:MAG: hypothetical protein U5K30_01460 [Acidimicrobiales bacterium]|nr:hypothetical protein [Acidimicrobiales bacterium]